MNKHHPSPNTAKPIRKPVSKEVDSLKSLLEAGFDFDFESGFRDDLDDFDFDIDSSLAQDDGNLLKSY